MASPRRVAISYKFALTPGGTGTSFLLGASSPDVRESITRDEGVMTWSVNSPLPQNQAKCFVQVAHALLLKVEPLFCTLNFYYHHKL